MADVLNIPSSSNLEISVSLEVTKYISYITKNFNVIKYFLNFTDWNNETNINEIVNENILFLIEIKKNLFGVEYDFLLNFIGSLIDNLINEIRLNFIDLENVFEINLFIEKIIFKLQYYRQLLIKYPIN